MGTGVRHVRLAGMRWLYRFGTLAVTVIALAACSGVTPTPTPTPGASHHGYAVGVTHNVADGPAVAVDEPLIGPAVGPAEPSSSAVVKIDQVGGLLRRG